MQPSRGDRARTDRGVSAPPRWSAAALAIALAGSSHGCALAPRPVALPADDGVATALLLTMRLSRPLDKIARHPWFAVRDNGSRTWERWEIWDTGQWGYVRRKRGGPLDGPEVRLHAVLRGEAAERFIACLRRESPRYEHRDLYLPWPGPNSNTYADVMMRRCGLRGELPPTSIGKDYRGVIGVSRTSGGTGVQFETPLVGLRIGLTEGIQLHLLGLTVGVDFWPPAIVFPLGEGRIGFADR